MANGMGGMHVREGGHRVSDYHAPASPRRPAPAPMPKLSERERERRRQQLEQEALSAADVASWSDLDQLARSLGVPIRALAALGCGVCQLASGVEGYSFPAVDGDRRVVGVATRSLDGDKGMIAGYSGVQQPGLFVPLDLDLTSDAPLYLCEGPTDTAALWAMYLAAIGRPSNCGGAEYLAQLLRDYRGPLLIVADNDRKPDGSWPGLDGARRLARQLQQLLGREVKIALPPDGHKDTRSLFNAQRPDLANADALHRLGWALEEQLWANVLAVEQADALLAQTQAAAAAVAVVAAGDGLAAHESLPLGDTRRLALLAGTLVTEGPPAILPSDPLNAMDQAYALLLIGRLLGSPPGGKAPSERLVREMAALAVEAAAARPRSGPLFLHDRKAERCCTPYTNHLVHKHCPRHEQIAHQDCNRNICDGCFRRKRTSDKNDVADRFIETYEIGEVICLLTEREYQRLRSRVARQRKKWKEGGRVGPPPQYPSSIRVLADGGEVTRYAALGQAGPHQCFTDVADAILHMAAAVDAMTPLGVATGRHRVRFDGEWQRKKKPPSQWAVIGKIRHDREGVLDILRRHRVPEDKINVREFRKPGRHWSVYYELPETWTPERVAALHRDLHAPPLPVAYQLALREGGFPYSKLVRGAGPPRAAGPSQEGGGGRSTGPPDDGWAFWAPEKPPG